MSLIKKLMQIGAAKHGERDVIKIMLAKHMGESATLPAEWLDKIERQAVRELHKAGLDESGTYEVRVYKFGDTANVLFRRELRKGKLK